MSRESIRARLDSQPQPNLMFLDHFRHDLTLLLAVADALLEADRWSQFSPGSGSFAMAIPEPDWLRIRDALDALEDPA